ncbi:hypothetical protein RB195_020374 [Necator americanus]|uniref:SCP domain-containing protein n=1 Tax=Necator americanus TaxID=51031 RepID=A0ABR1CKW7_NECAM
MIRITATSVIALILLAINVQPTQGTDWNQLFNRTYHTASRYRYTTLEVEPTQEPTPAPSPVTKAATEAKTTRTRATWTWPDWLHHHTKVTAPEGPTAPEPATTERPAPPAAATKPKILVTKASTKQPVTPHKQTSGKAVTKTRTTAHVKTEKPVTPKKVTKAPAATKAKTQKPPPPKPQTTKKVGTQKPPPPKPQTTKKAKTQKPAPPKPQPTKKAKTQKPAPPKPQPTKKAKTQKPAPPKPRPTKKVQPKPQPPPPPGPKKDSWPKATCANKRLTDDVRQVFLEMHNNFRGSLALGKTEKNHGSGAAPPAALMYKMKYNCDLESYSQQHAGSCNVKPLPPTALNGYRENIYVLRTPNTPPMVAAKHTVNAWWKELAENGIASNMLFTAGEYKRGTKHILNWSKMAWDNNRSVGCAVHNCGKFMFIVCTYSEGGNRQNKHVYTIGAVCSKCPKGQCDSQGLCRW